MPIQVLFYTRKEINDLFIQEVAKRDSVYSACEDIGMARSIYYAIKNDHSTVIPYIRDELNLRAVRPDLNRRIIGFITDQEPDFSKLWRRK